VTEISVAEDKALLYDLIHRVAGGEVAPIQHQIQTGIDH
jgi:hypothetical protein